MQEHCYRQCVLRIFVDSFPRHDLMSSTPTADGGPYIERRNSEFISFALFSIGYFCAVEDGAYSHFG
jgi:hypothetical protein